MVFVGLLGVVNGKERELECNKAIGIDTNGVYAGKDNCQGISTLVLGKGAVL